MTYNSSTIGVESAFFTALWRKVLWGTSHFCDKYKYLRADVLFVLRELSIEISATVKKDLGDIFYLPLGSRNLNPSPYLFDS